MGCTASTNRSESFEARKAKLTNKLFLCPQSLNLIEGSSMEGVVLLEITQTIRTLAIHITVTGEVQTRGNENLVYFLNVSKALYEPPDYILNPGQYAIPFNLKLPDELPSSFSLISPNSSSKVSYKVEAFSMLADKRSLKASQNFSVTQKVGQEIIEYVADPEKTFKVCDFEEKGKLLWKVRTNKETYQFNEPIEVFLEVINKSIKEIKHLQIRLVRIINIHDHSNSLPIREDMLLRDFKVKIKPNSIHTNAEARHIVINLREIRDKLYQANTTRCKYLTCTYMLEFIQPGSLFKAQKTLLEHEVKFVPKILPPPSAPALPARWQPVYLNAIADVNTSPMVPQTVSLPD